MDPEFQRALITVLILGTIIAVVGGILLFAIFRRFGGKSYLGLVGALIGFIFLCCLALLLISHE